MEFYIDIIRFASIGIISLTIVTFFNSRKRNQNVQIGMVFLVGVICYLLIDWGQLNHLIFYLLFVGTVSIPIMFWFFTRSIFDDNFQFARTHIIIYICTITTYFILHLVNENQLISHELLGLISHKMGQLISLVFIILGIAEAYRGKGSDLVEARIKVRSIIIYLIGLIITLTLIVELALDLEPFSAPLSLAQKSFIFILSFGFAAQMFDLKSGFFAPQKNTEAQIPDIDPQLQEKLKGLIINEKVYLREGLTIRLLAEQMNVQEYKLRRVINHKLGFKNFNDFLNSYRIQDACEKILDRQNPDKTILEIAYEVGYSSLGPFNKAFRQHTNTTPTQYRKNMVEE